MSTGNPDTPTQPPPPPDDSSLMPRSRPSIRSFRSIQKVNERRVYLNAPLPQNMLDVRGERKARFPPNNIRTSKYTRWNFVPKNLFEQFRRVANQYFLFLAIIQLIPYFGVNSPVLSIMPISAVVFITAAKDGFEDWKRHVVDEEVNNSITLILKGDKWKNTNYPNGVKRKSGIVGDLVSACSSCFPSSKKSNDKEDLEGGDVEAKEEAAPNNATPPKDQEQANRSRTSFNSKLAANTEFVEVTWQEVHVGDVVLLRANDPVPADMVILASNDPEGICYVETKELDGETNLKAKFAPADIVFALRKREKVGHDHSHHHVSEEDTFRETVSTLRLFVESEAPSANLFSHNAAITILSSAGRSSSPSSQVELPNNGSTNLVNAAKQPLPLNVDNLLLRGHVIRNTTWAIGLVIFTGPETKIMLNAGRTPSKRSQIERVMNQQVILACTVLFLLCVGSVIASRFHKNWEESALPVALVTEFWSVVGECFLSFFAALIMFQNMVPISLYVSIEFVKSLQAYFIWADVKMYHEPSDRSCKPKSWNLSDDLGQIEYVFSDKTGTLTRNLMEFRRCAVNDVIYGAALPDPLAEAKARSSHQSLPKPQVDEASSSIEEWGKKVSALGPNALNHAGPPEKMTFRDSRVLEALAEAVYEGDGAKEHTQGNDVRDFFACLAVCHTAVIEMPEEFDEEDDEEEDEDEKKSKEKKIPDSQNKTSPTESVKSTAKSSAVASPPPTSTSNKRIVPVYKAESPDENALVAAARDVGFAFLGRIKPAKKASADPNAKKQTGKNIVQVSMPDGEKDMEFEILAVLQFDSTRKRMSAIVRRPAPWNDIAVLMKGADSIVMERLSKDQPNGGKAVEAIQTSVDHFAREGLRTLLLAWKPLTEGELANFLDAHAKASSSINDRPRLLAEAAEMVENNMLLLGATAIEDRLGEGVPESVRILRQAGIKVWVLTGDKMETAINIGYSCQLLEPETEVLRVTSAGGKRGALDSFNDIKARLVSEGVELIYPTQTSTFTTIWARLKQIFRPLQIFYFCCGPRDFIERHKNPCLAGSCAGKDRALVVDGQGLKHLLDDPVARRDLLAVTRSFASVICCRASPLQKAQVVELVRGGTGALCLAIGDGANDVSMIQAANVGVGISGEEGVQAALAADYAIAQFRHLAPLLLVHGTWSYARISEMILNFFYKNIVFTFVPLWYMFVSQFSANLFYDYGFVMLYNLVFTLLPVLIIGCSDQVVSRTSCLRFPQLYLLGINQRRYSMPHFWLYFLEAVFQSLMIYLLGTHLFNQGYPVTVDVDGTNQPTGSLLELSTACALLAISTVNIFNGMNTYHWVWAMHVAVWLSIVVAFSFVLVYGAFPNSPLEGVAESLFPSLNFWLFMVIGLVICLGPRYTFLFVKRTWWPSDDDIVREIQRADRENRDKKRSGRRVEEGYYDNDFDQGEFDEDRILGAARPKKPASSSPGSNGAPPASSADNNSQQRPANNNYNDNGTKMRDTIIPPEPLRTPPSLLRPEDDRKNAAVEDEERRKSCVVVGQGHQTASGSYREEHQESSITNSTTTSPSSFPFVPAKRLSGKVEDYARISLKRVPLYINVHEHEEVSTAEGLEQGYVTCESDNRFLLLFTFLKKNLKKKVIVLFSSNNSVKYHAELLNYIDIPVLNLHGRQKQQKRTNTIFEFMNADNGILLATGVAARGLDIPSVDWIIQYDPPDDPRDYIYRVGRTARVGRSGQSLLFLLPSELGFLRYLKHAKVPLKEYQFPLSKLASVHPQLERLVEKNHYLKKAAKDGYRSYLKACASHCLKNVFDVERLDLVKCAKAFGFALPPKVNVVIGSAAPKEKKRNKGKIGEKVKEHFLRQRSGKIGPLKEGGGRQFSR